MEMNQQQYRKIINATQRLARLMLTLLVFVIALLISVLTDRWSEESADKEKLLREYKNKNESRQAKDDFWLAPEIYLLDNQTDKEFILYGRDIIEHTSKYFGPAGIIDKNATNGMNCQNCHLDAGTKIFGNNYSGVASTYPKYRARSGTSENIYKRVNDCFERSLNGRSLDTLSNEMQAIKAYIYWLGKDVPKGEKPKGSGLKDLAFLDRAANPENGKKVYELKCQSCHQVNGQGIFNADKTAYTYPPLWGNNSYNIGAGLYRISNFAKYVKYNMPLGADHKNPQLSDEEAWDVAAYVNSKPRPLKDLSKDWPKIEEKPVDHPFGPYADDFSEKQHKYGPFQPIKEKMDDLKSKNKTKANT